MDFWEYGGREEGSRRRLLGWMPKDGVLLCCHHILHHRLQHFIASASSCLTAGLFKNSGGVAVMELSHTGSPPQSGWNKRFHTGGV